jgi:YHS domain-containing protein
VLNLEEFMKRNIAGAGAVLVLAAAAWAAQGKPINDECPIKGSPIKAGITSTYKGKTVGLCCGNCKGQFDADPEKYAASIPGLAGPQPRTGLTSAEDALAAGKEGTKPVVLLFTDGGPKAKLFGDMLGDASLDESFGKVAFANVEYKKGDEEAKKFKVSAAPTLLILDPRGETPKELKKMAGGSPASIKAEIEKAVKALAKK